MIATLLHDPIAVAAMCAERSGGDDCDLQEFDDNTVRVLGTPPSGVREALLLTHVEGGRDSDGWVIWYPKEAGHDS